VIWFRPARTPGEKVLNIRALARKPDHDARALPWQVPMREHMEIYTREKRLHSIEILADELRLRLATLDVNPFYNKDTFVHKTAAFLRWKEQETENINLMLSVCRCQRHSDHPRM
jgi:hypothetical protein